MAPWKVSDRSLPILDVKLGSAGAVAVAASTAALAVSAAASRCCRAARSCSWACLRPAVPGSWNSPGSVGRGPGSLPSWEALFQSLAAWL